MWGVSLTHLMLAWCLSVEFLWHIPCWLHFFFFFFKYLRSFTYTPHAGFIFVWGVTCPMLVLLFCGEFLLHIPCWVFFYVASFSYTSHADFVFMWGVSLTHPVLPSFLSKGVSLILLNSFFSFFFCFVLHIPCCLLKNSFREFRLHIPWRLHFHLGRSS